jgi:uncharacterized coiled-coil DUF342 family protein
MVDESNIRRAIEQSSEHTTLSNLANRGIRNVKVLDEQGLLDLIRQAVDQVVHTQTAEERSKLLADSRKQLQKLMNERDEFLSRAGLAEATKNELVQQVERLQQELKLRRDVEEQEAHFQAQLKEIADRHKGCQDRIGELEGENVWLREEHDRLVEQLDQAQSEIKRLREELERLRAAAGEQAGLREELEAARAEAAGLGERLAGARSQAEERLAGLEEEKSRLSQDLEDALKEVDNLRTQLEGLRAEAAGGEAQARQEVELAREEVARLEERLAERERELQEERKPRPEPLVILERPDRKAPPPPPPAPPPEPEVAEVAPEEAAAAGVATVRAVGLPEGAKAGKGLDIGTVNLVAAEQNGRDEIELRLQRNAFIDIEITAYTRGMLTRLNVPYFVQGKRMYVLGEHAFELANILNRNTRRPMKDGLISPKETDALPVMKLLIGSILGEPRVPNEVCFYSVPGEPVDSDLSVAYHRDLFDAVLKALGYKPSHIIEGHAVTFAELADEDFTGIGVSCGGGMFNICVAYKSMPALVFSTARSGDWVDNNVAQALGIKAAKASMIKEKGVDLMNPRNREEDAISIYYRNLIKYNLMNIAERFRAAENMPTFPEPISVVFSGGTSMAGNFIELVKAVFKEIDFPIPVKDIRLAKDPLNATAKGALAAAILEMTQQAGSTAEPA